MNFLYEGKLNKLDLTIARKIEENPTIITSCTIFEAAELLDVSPSKLTKYCQKIKLKGFKEIKYKLVQDEATQQIEDELSISEFKIKRLIDKETHQKLLEVPKLLRQSTKIIVVASAANYSLASYISTKLRIYTKRDAVPYINTQNFGFECTDPNVVIIIIDEENEISDFSVSWFRPGNKYIHITKKIAKPVSGYYPLKISKRSRDLPFDAIVILLFRWMAKNISN